MTAIFLPGYLSFRLERLCVPFPAWLILALCPPHPVKSGSLSVFAEVGVSDLRSDVELGRLDLQLGDLIDCCSYRARSEYQASFWKVAFAALLACSSGRIAYVVVPFVRSSRCSHAQYNVNIAQIVGWLRPPWCAGEHVPCVYDCTLDGVLGVTRRRFRKNLLTSLLSWYRLGCHTKEPRQL